MQKFAQKDEVDVATGRVRRANTTSAAPRYPSSVKGKESSQHDGRPKGDVNQYDNVTGGAADKKYPSSGLLARPATSFASTTPYQQLKPPIFSKQSPEKGTSQRRQSSLDAQSTVGNGLFGARARLRSIDHGTSEDPVEASRCTNLLPVRRRPDIHDLQDLIDHAIDEQAELDIIATSTKQSPRLKSIPSQVEMSMTSPSKGQSIETRSGSSPVRRGRSIRNSSHPRISIAARTTLGSKNGDHPPSSPGQQLSPTRKQRLSTESVLPRSSVDSGPSATSAYPSDYSSSEMKPRHEIFHLHRPPPVGQAPSPVKERTAAFEKMMQHDKQIMSEQQHKNNGNIYVKKHWWLESDDSQTNHTQGVVKQEPNATATEAGRNVPRNPPTSTCSVTPTLRSGPIPLALPQLISSRGRVVSTSSQFDDSFETAPQSEAALSRLSSRVHSPRTVLKASGAQDIGNELKSPLFRWKAFMLDKRSPADKEVPVSPQESGLEANAGKDVAEQARDTVSHLQHRAKDLSGANQDATSQREQDESTVRAVVRSHDVGKTFNTCRPIRESCELQVLTPERLTLPNTASTKLNRFPSDGSEIHHEVAQTEQRWSSGDMAVDDGKEVAAAQTDESTEKYGEAAIESAIEATISRQRRSRDSMPFPLIPVEASGSASASASGPGSPIRGRAASRTLSRQSTVMKEEGNQNGVRVSRSRSKAGNVRVTVEVRTPQGSPVKPAGDKDRKGQGNGSGERVVIVTTDVQGEEQG